MSTERYPHRRARDERYRHYCACGDSVPEEMFTSPASPLSPSYTWGSDCPAALREALVEARRERDELAATLANERGEGDPPCEGWRWADCGGWGWAWVLGDGPDEWIAVHHKPGAGWYVRLGPAYIRIYTQVAVSYHTARAAMLAASAARST